MCNTAAFRGLTGQTDPKIGLTLKQVSTSMREAFQKAMNDSSELNEKEVDKLSKLIMRGLDNGGDGTIDLAEFVNSCASNEQLQIEDISKFFDEDRRKSCLERIFDDTKIEQDD